MELARILAGWPRLASEVDEKTIPQEVRLDEIGGVSYTKGCYTGQETVSRCTSAVTPTGSCAACCSKPIRRGAGERVGRRHTRRARRRPRHQHRVAPRRWRIGTGPLDRSRDAAARSPHRRHGTCRGREARSSACRSTRRTSLRRDPSTPDDPRSRHRGGRARWHSTSSRRLRAAARDLARSFGSTRAPRPCPRRRTGRWRGHRRAHVAARPRTACGRSCTPPRSSHRTTHSTNSPRVNVGGTRLAIDAARRSGARAHSCLHGRSVWAARPVYAAGEPRVTEDYPFQPLPASTSTRAASAPPSNWCGMRPAAGDSRRSRSGRRDLWRGVMCCSPAS